MIFIRYFTGKCCSGCIVKDGENFDGFVQVADWRDFYTCGHLAKRQRGLGRVAVEGDLWKVIYGLNLLLSCFSGTYPREGFRASGMLRMYEQLSHVS